MPSRRPDPRAGPASTSSGRIRAAARPRDRGAHRRRRGAPPARFRAGRAQRCGGRARASPRWDPTCSPRTGSPPSACWCASCATRCCCSCSARPAVSSLTGDATDGAIIAAIVVLSASASASSTSTAPSWRVAALHAHIRHEAIVRRDDHELRIDVRELVPGDVVELAVGDWSPPTCGCSTRTRSSATSRCSPASRCRRRSRPRRSRPRLGGRPAVVRVHGHGRAPGLGRGVVVGTGGRRSSAASRPGSASSRARPRSKSACATSRRCSSKVAGGAHDVDLRHQLAFSRPLIDALLFSLAIAIGITPQLLPAIVSVSLSIGSRDLAQAQGAREAAGRDRGPRQHRGAVHRQDRHAHRGRDHLRPGARRSRGSVRRGAAARPALQRGDDHRRRAGRAATRSTSRCGTRPARRIEAGAGTGTVAGYTRVGLLPFDHDRQLASVVVDRRPTARRARHQGRARRRCSRAASTIPTARRPRSTACSATARASSRSRRPRPRPRRLDVPIAADERDLDARRASSPSPTGRRPTPGESIARARPASAST